MIEPISPKDLRDADVVVLKAAITGLRAVVTVCPSNVPTYSLIVSYLGCLEYIVELKEQLQLERLGKL